MEILRWWPHPTRQAEAGLIGFKGLSDRLSRVVRSEHLAIWQSGFIMCDSKSACSRKL